MHLQYFEHKDVFRLESGAYLPGFRLAYTTHGRLNDQRDNVVWVIHALTANANLLEWWPGVVGSGCPIDTDRYFVVCANTLGSHYGSTGPLDIHPESGKAWLHDFPVLTIRDMAASLSLLRKHLNIRKIRMLAGASMGGQQALEWAISEPEVFDRLLLIATNARHSAWGIAFNESQRMAIENDPTWLRGTPEDGLQGMKTARSIALLSYRTYAGYVENQTDSDETFRDFRAGSYQRYQGDKLAKRFNAYSYYRLSQAMDSHHVGRGRGGIEAALSRIQAQTHILGIRSDLLFPFEEQKLLAKHIPGARLYEIDSALGHDGFLTESEQVGKVILKILAIPQMQGSRAGRQLKPDQSSS